ncbi:MAG: hypothetical protein LBT05_05240 [Planctomycetaceae bacterium]|jgi:hypothetical protein|nr:hypothetical protein [Planctomycetaceae bacterium]
MSVENDAYFLQQLDLLVDGELPEEERKNFLTVLDQLPDGWKKCAVAFLEAQLFAQALQTPVRSTIPQRSNNAVCVKSQRRRRQTSAAICISLAAVVLGGLLVYQWKNPQIAPLNTGGFVQNQNAPMQERQKNSTAFSNNEYEPAYFMNPVNPTFANLTSQKMPKPEYVTLSMDDSRQTAQIPCYRFGDIDAGRYLNSPPSISHRELQRIIQRGGDVDVNRHNLVVPVGNNRHAVIPVDQIIVKYNGGNGVL